MREQRVMLGHDADLSARDWLAVGQMYRARVGRFESGQQAQQRRFARARRPQQRADLALLQVGAHQFLMVKFTSRKIRLAPWAKETRSICSSVSAVV